MKNRLISLIILFLVSFTFFADPDNIPKAKEKVSTINYELIGHPARWLGIPVSLPCLDYLNILTLTL